MLNMRKSERHGSEGESQGDRERWGWGYEGKGECIEHLSRPG